MRTRGHKLQNHFTSSSESSSNLPRHCILKPAQSPALLSLPYPLLSLPTANQLAKLKTHRKPSRLCPCSWPLQGVSSMNSATWGLCHVLALLVCQQLARLWTYLPLNKFILVSRLLCFVFFIGIILNTLFTQLYSSTWLHWLVLCLCLELLHCAP